MKGARLGVLILAALAGGLVAARAMGEAQPAGDPAAGESLFEDRCLMCHVPAGGGQGPSLKGVLDRKAGAVPGFPYTAALKGSGLVWNAATLDRFLTDPGKLVPGTAMPLHLPDPKQRRDIISYLAQSGDGK